jgi:hypothetical protein
MPQNNAGPRSMQSIDSLGLAAWGPNGRPAPESTLGSLADVLGEFLAPAPPCIVVPAQRSASPLPVNR